MIVRWTSPALRDVETLGDYVASFNTEAADRIVRAVFAQTDTLAQFPFKGRIGRVASTRELVVSGTQFIVCYRVQADLVELLAVLHTSRRWPDDF